jgi:putative MATE family efflux protein
LNFTFVYGLGWGIAGSAIGTVVAQSAAAATLALVVARAARRAGAPLAAHVGGIRAAWRAGVPLMVRTLTLRVALLLTTFVAASISTTAVAAHQVALTLWAFLAFALDAVAIAGQAITGRLLGAGDAEGARAATARMVWWGVVTGVALGAVVLASRDLVAPLFTDDQAVQTLIASALVVVALHQPIAGVVFVLDGVLIGAGDGRYLAGAGLLTLAVFAPLAGTVLWAGGGLVWLWWAFVGFMVARLITLVWRARGDEWLVLGAAAPRQQPIRRQPRRPG